MECPQRSPLRPFRGTMKPPKRRKVVGEEVGLEAGEAETPKEEGVEEKKEVEEGGLEKEKVVVADALEEKDLEEQQEQKVQVEEQQLESNEDEEDEHLGVASLANQDVNEKGRCSWVVSFYLHLSIIIFNLRRVIMQPGDELKTLLDGKYNGILELQQEFVAREQVVRRRGVEGAVSNLHLPYARSVCGIPT